MSVAYGNTKHSYYEGISIWKDARGFMQSSGNIIDAPEV